MDYYVIVCKNKLNSSVITENPHFESTKQDKEFHGNGLDIIQEKVKNNNGYLKILEEKGDFVIMVFLPVRSTPEN